MKKRRELKTREELLMNYLWSQQMPMTPNEIANEFNKDGWSTVTVYKTIQALCEEEYLEIESFEKTVKTYARRLVPTMTKEDYYSQYLMDKGINSNDLAELTASFIGVSNLRDKEKNKKVINKLEEIIVQLKGEE